MYYYIVCQKNNYYNIQDYQLMIAAMTQHIITHS